MNPTKFVYLQYTPDSPGYWNWQYLDEFGIDFGGISQPFSFPDNCLGTGLLESTSNPLPLCNCLQPWELRRVLVRFKFCCPEVYEEVLCQGTAGRDIDDGGSSECFPEWWYVNVSYDFIINYPVNTVFLMKNPYILQYGADFINSTLQNQSQVEELISSTYGIELPPWIQSGENVGIQHALMTYGGFVGEYDPSYTNLFYGNSNNLSVDTESSVILILIIF